jgi:membrane associated rhomboid family serine protease
VSAIIKKKLSVIVESGTAARTAGMRFDVASAALPGMICGVRTAPKGKFRQLLREQGVLLGLIALMFLIYFVQVGVGVRWYYRLMAVPGEIIESLERVRAGEAAAADWLEFGTLVSCAFLHAGIDHVALNMIFLWVFGALMVELIGWRWMLGIFFATAAAGSATHVAMNHESFIPLVGASGGVLGLEGAYLGLASRWRLPDPHVWPLARPIPPGQLAFFAVLGVALNYFAIFGGQVSATAFGAHVGGFTMGLLITGLIAPRPRTAQVR